MCAKRALPDLKLLIFSLEFAAMFNCVYNIYDVVYKLKITKILLDRLRCK